MAPQKNTISLEKLAQMVKRGFDDVGQRMGLFERRIGSIEGRMGSIENRMGSLEDEVKTGFSSLRVQVSDLDERIGHEEKFSSDLYDGLSTRVKTLEKKAKQG